MHKQLEARFAAVHEASRDTPSSVDAGHLVFVNDPHRLTQNERMLQSVFALYLSDVDEAESYYGEVLQ